MDGTQLGLPGEEELPILIRNLGNLTIIVNCKIEYYTNKSYFI